MAAVRGLLYHDAIQKRLTGVSLAVWIREMGVEKVPVEISSDDGVTIDAEARGQVIVCPALTAISGHVDFVEDSPCHDVLIVDGIDAYRGFTGAYGRAALLYEHRSDGRHGMVSEIGAWYQSAVFSELIIQWC